MIGSSENVSQTGIFFACTENEKLVTEQIIPEHMLMHVYAGKFTITTADKSYEIFTGQTVLFSKNQLAKFTKESDGDIDFKAVTIFFTKPFLQQFYEGVPSHQKISDFKVLYIEPHVLLNNLFESVSLYSNLEDALISKELTILKVRETLTVIRTLSKNVDMLLSDFSEPYKIDLADFMQKNFMFNISISRFAYLTGRSLATFKRDFEKIFNTSPSRWLQQKRLQEAHYLIKDKGKAPLDIYLDLGFEDLSHFSFAFKKKFGVAPSKI